MSGECGRLISHQQIQQCWQVEATTVALSYGVSIRQNSIFALGGCQALKTKRTAVIFHVLYIFVLDV